MSVIHVFVKKTIERHLGMYLFHFTFISVFITLVIQSCSMLQNRFSERNRRRFAVRLGALMAQWASVWWCGTVSGLATASPAEVVDGKFTTDRPNKMPLIPLGRIVKPTLHFILHSFPAQVVSNGLINSEFVRRS